MDATMLQQLMVDQDGVVSRRQVLDVGGDDNLIERMLHTRRWASLHRGVYVDHTGPPSWRQRAWAGVLYHWPAALCHVSALRLHGLAQGPPLADEPIHVAVDAVRRPRGRAGIRAHRLVRLDERLHPSRTPPRLRLEDAVLDVAADARDEAGAVAVIADACQSRRTTAEWLHRRLESRPRLPRRAFLLSVVADAATGAFSVLEHRYLVKVERPHGLPTGRRQRAVRTGRGSAYRDVEYTGRGVVVELDGRLGHEFQQDRWDDLDRDIAGVVSGDLTIRVGWRQVLEPCRLAAVVGRLLRARGWTGHVKLCGPGCAVGRLGGPSPAPGAGNGPRTDGWSAA